MGYSADRGRSYTYRYDHNNRLTGVYDDTDTTRKAAFAYDALGRRIVHVNDALGTTTRYFFDGVATLDATDDKVADHEVGERRAFAIASRASELAEYADNGTGNGNRGRYPALDALRRALPPCRRRECRAFAACQG